MRSYLIAVFLYLCCLTTVLTQEHTVPLWPESVPNQRVTDEVEKANQGDILWISNVQEPTLEVFLPVKKNATGQAVIICPGGGYAGLAYDWEGIDIAKALNARGIAAFVLKYRLPMSKSLIDPKMAPLQDAQRAIRLVRQDAALWNVAPDKIGIMGFSAGGHLASTLGTHYNDPPPAADDLKTVSARPDFMILIYPVITMDETFTHMGSRNNLIGSSPDESLIKMYSNELHVTNDTPPTFLLHTTVDRVVPVKNSLVFYQALIDAGVSAEMHIYPEGEHGFSLALGQGRLCGWIDLLFSWMTNREQ